MRICRTIKVNPSMPAQDLRKFSQVSARGLRRFTIVACSIDGDDTANGREQSATSG